MLNVMKRCEIKSQFKNVKHHFVKTKDEITLLLLLFVIVQVTSKRHFLIAHVAQYIFISIISYTRT